MKQIRFTKEGFENIKQEYADLLTKRPAVIEDLQKARELGGLKETGQSFAAKINFH